MVNNETIEINKHNNSSHDPWIANLKKTHIYRKMLMIFWFHFAWIGSKRDPFARFTGIRLRTCVNSKNKHPFAEKL